MSQRDRPVDPVFATHAPPMRRAGFAVVPAQGKKPIRKGYSTWRRAPGAEAVGKWAEEGPDADIVYVPRRSRPKPDTAGIVVLGGHHEPKSEAHTADLQSRS